VVSAESNGQKVPDAEIAKVKFAIKGAEMSFKEETDTKTATFKIDSSKKPAQIDIIPKDGPEKDKTMRGIYELDGDTLKLCVRGMGEGRPTEFKSDKDVTVMVLKRVKS